MNGYFLFISQGKGYYDCDDNGFLLVVRLFPPAISNNIGNTEKHLLRLVVLVYRSEVSLWYNANTQYYYRKTEINLTKAVCYISISILYWFPCQFLVGPLLWRPWESHRGLTRSPEPEPEPKPHPHPTSLHLVFLCSASTRGLNRRLLIRLHQTGLHWSLRESYEISFSDWLAVGEDWEGMFIPQIN